MVSGQDCCALHVNSAAAWRIRVLLPQSGGFTAPPTTLRAHPSTSPECVCGGGCLCTPSWVPGVCVCVSVCGWGCLQTVLAALRAVQPCPLLGLQVGRSAPGTRPLRVLPVPQVNLTPLGLLAQACESSLDHTHRASVCLPLRLVFTLGPCCRPAAREGCVGARALALRVREGRQAERDPRLDSAGSPWAGAAGVPQGPVRKHSVEAPFREEWRLPRRAQ